MVPDALVDLVGGLGTEGLSLTDLQENNSRSDNGSYSELPRAAESRERTVGVMLVTAVR